MWNGLFKHAPIHGLYDYKKQTLVNTMYWLADCYEKDYQFDKALITYESMINILPNYSSGYIGKTSILTKTNHLDLALNWLKSIKKSHLYKTYSYIDEIGNKYINNDFKDSIDKLINETESKIKKGYIYTPRKK